MKNCAATVNIHQSLLDSYKIALNQNSCNICVKNTLHADLLLSNNLYDHLANL